MLFLIEIDDETGYPTRYQLPGEEKMGPMARVTYNSLRFRYKAIQQQLIEYQREQEARQAEEMLREKVEDVVTHQLTQHLRGVM